MSDTKVNRVNLFNKIRNKCKENIGVNFAIDAYGEEILVIANAEHVKILLKDTELSTIKDLTWLSRAIGPSRISENGVKWEVRRDITQSHMGMVSKNKIFEVVSKSFYQFMSSHCEKTNYPVNLNLIFELVLDIFLRYYFNTDLKKSEIDSELVRKMIGHASSNSFIPEHNIFNMNEEEKKLYFNKLKSDRNKLLGQLSKFRDYKKFNSPILTDLLAAEERAEVFLEQELMTIIAAGVESTSSTLGWSMLMLSDDYQFQNDCHIDADNIISCENKDDISKLDRLDFLIDETLRRFPGFPLLSRTAVREIILDDYRIGRGQNFIISLMENSYCNTFGDCGSLGQLYAQVNKKAQQAPQNFAFGGGRRICAGMSFAKFEIKAILVHILQAFSIVPAATNCGTIKWRLSMVPVDHYGFSLARRRTTATLC